MIPGPALRRGRSGTRTSSGLSLGRAPSENGGQPPVDDCSRSALHLIPLRATPWMNCFCARKYPSTIGRIESVEAAISPP